MSGFGIIAFDQLFTPVKATPVNADRLFGFDSEGNVNAAFTIAGLRQAFGGGDWNTMANRPSTFTPSSHTLASHSDTQGLSAAPDGVFMAKVAGRWRGVVPDFARSEDIPQIGTHILSISAQNISQWSEAHGWGDHAGLYRPANWQPTWSQVTGKPSVFAPAPHSLASHSDAEGLAGALVGQLARKGETGWESWTPDYYGPENPAPSDATVPDFVRDLDPVRLNLFDEKVQEFVDFPDGSLPMLVNGRPLVSGINVRLTENPFDQELEPEKFDSWTPEVVDFTFTRPVRGVNAVNEDEFVTKSQLDQAYSEITEAESDSPTSSTIRLISGRRLNSWASRQGFLTSLPSHTHAASEIVSGVLATARLGSGTANSTVFLRGDGTWNQVSWGNLTGVPATFAPSAHNLNSHSDVSIDSVATGQLLRWNGSAWANWTPNFLTSFTETDPTVPAHVKAITTAQITNWNTAFGWGNHAGLYVNKTGDTMTGTLNVNPSNFNALNLSTTNPNSNVRIHGQGTSDGGLFVSSNNSISFLTGSNLTANGTERMRIASDGNVLIGTTSELTGGGRLQVSGLITAETGLNNTALRINNGGEPSFNLRAQVISNGPDSNKFKFGLYFNNIENSTIGFWRGNTITGGFLTFHTNDGTERMRITSGGNILMGTTIELSGGGRLQVSGTINTSSHGNSSQWNQAFGWGNHAGLYIPESNSISNLNTASPPIGLSRFSSSGFQASNSPNAAINYWSILDFRHRIAEEFRTQLATGSTGILPQLWLRNNTNGSWGDWREILHDGNHSHRSDAQNDARYSQLGHTHPWSQITGAPAFLTAEADTLATVTARGATTGQALTFTGVGSHRGFSIRTSDASGNNWSWFAMGGTSDNAGNVWHIGTNGTAQDIGLAGAFHIRGNNGVTSSMIINQDHSVRFRSASVFLGATTNNGGVQVVTNSGTWGISISGNAATVTNGVYTTGDQTIGGIKSFSTRLRIVSGGSSWIGGHRDEGANGIFISTTATTSSYHRWISQRTPAGGFSLGTLNNDLYITWGTSADIDANTNSVSQVFQFRSNGDFRFTGTLQNGSVPWDRISGTVATINGAGSALHNHGSFSVTGTKGGYAGISFSSANAVFMIRDTDQLSGVYHNNNSWKWMFDGNGTLSVGTVPWARLSGIPTTFTPSAHNHDASNITSGTLASARLSGTYGISITGDSASVEGIGLSGLTRATVFSDGSGDFNAMTGFSGISSINASANTPFGAAWYTLYNNRHRGGTGDGNSWGSQIAIGMTAHETRIAFRVHNNSSWMAWNEILSTANHSHRTDAQNDSRYVRRDNSNQAVTDVWLGTQAQYNSITVNANTLYFIID